MTLMIEKSPTASSDESIGIGISNAERELLTDVLRSLRGMRYGSILLTVHDGRLVEIQKTERIRGKRGHGERQSMPTR